jgi:Tetratricopeptide repeat/Peptidase_C39 like family
VLLRFAAFLALVAVIGGCAADPFKAAPRPGTPAAVELVDAPFFPQQEYQCGPAALATVLVDSGVTVHPDELVPRVYLPQRQGSLQPELLAAARHYDRIPYVIPPEFPALLAEVSQGRPVLVLQNLGVKAFPAWHYAVVVGYARERGEVVLRSGLDERRVTPASTFANTWRRGGSWGIVALQPGELPATDDSSGYLRALAAAESAGRVDLAEPSYWAAAKRWPDNSLAWLGLGNSAYARGEQDAAERMYRHALEIDPGNAAALNNLASTVAEQGRCDEARNLLTAAMALPDLHVQMADVLLQSRDELSACR